MTTPANAPLTPYDEDARCPKCGHEVVATSYEKNGHCYGHSYPNNWCPTPTSKPECCEAEHFHRTCQRCRYQWAEAVIGKGSYAERGSFDDMRSW